MLHVRSVSNEEKYKSYEQRSMLIIISPPLWATPWAIAGYIILAVLVCVILFRIITLRKQKRISEEKTRFFYKYSSRHSYTSDSDKGPVGRTTEQRYGE